MTVWAALRSGLDDHVEVTQSALADQNYMGSSIRATDSQGIVLARTNVLSAVGKPVGTTQKPSEAYDKSYTHSLDEETAVSNFSGFKV